MTDSQATDEVAGVEYFVQMTIEMESSRGGMIWLAHSMILIVKPGGTMAELYQAALAITERRWINSMRSHGVRPEGGSKVINFFAHPNKLA